MKNLNDTTKFDEEFDTDDIGGIYDKKQRISDYQPDNFKQFILQDRQEVLDKVKSDLLEIADKGEIEDLRREVENYFNNLKK